MRRWVVIPIKAPEECKTRLSSVLGDNERQQLVAAMLRRTVEAAQTAAGREGVLLLGPSRHDLPENVPLLPDPGQGLNVALASARDTAASAGVDRLLLLSADLPKITAADVSALLDVPLGTVAASSDVAGVGTNALSLPLPAAARFSFHYGENSFAAHRDEAARWTLPFLSIDRPNLGLDIDQPEDIPLWG